MLPASRCEVRFAAAVRAAGHVGFDRRCPRGRRNMVLGPAVSWRRRNGIRGGPDRRSANGTLTRAIPKWSRVRISVLPPPAPFGAWGLQSRMGEKRGRYCRRFVACLHAGGAGAAVPFGGGARRGP